MTTRITRSFLDAKADTINRMTKSPVEPSQRIDGKYCANIGNYHISCAYGGYSLHRMVTEGGGARDVFDCGHIPARQLAALMSAYTTGLYDATR